MNKQHLQILNDINQFLKNGGYSATLRYLKKLQKPQRYQWLSNICNIQTSAGINDIQRLKKHFEKRLQVIKRNDIDVEINLNAKEQDNIHLKKSINLLKDFADLKEQIRVGNKVFEEGFKSDQNVDDLYDQSYFEEYINRKIESLSALKELHPVWGDICKFINGKKKTTSRDKTIRVREFSDDFIDDLSNGEFVTNKEVITALQKIEPKYKPVGKKESTPLRSDGTPIEKRICEALSKIFEIRNKNETIHWTTIRDAYREAGKSIS